MLMLGMAIALFATVSLIVISYPLNTPSPQVDIVSYVDGSQIILEHHGGPSLLNTTTIGIRINDSYTEIMVQNNIEEDFNQNNRWDIGERIIYNTQSLENKQVTVFVIDLNSNSIVMQGIIKETDDNGSGSSTPSLATNINPITPYTQTTIPLTVTAAGDSQLDNISLYYRWSTTNFTENTNTLTYDDFENGFGNYTDGGDDCILYTQSTHSAQGSNAVNLQDNSGDSSSFYYTDSVDILDPGYIQLTIDFKFKSISMFPNRSFKLLMYTGIQWETIRTYVYNTDFVDNQIYHEQIQINASTYTFSTDFKLKIECVGRNDDDDIYVDQIFVNATDSLNTEWQPWTNPNNPDTTSPWTWDFTFPEGPGYYEFYSIGSYNSNTETAPQTADARCYYNP